MEREEHSGFGLGTIFGVLVGVIALIIVIPVAAQLMTFNDPEPVVEEYHFKFSSSQYFFLSVEDDSYEFSDLSLSWYQMSLLSNDSNMSFSTDEFTFKFAAAELTDNEIDVIKLYTDNTKLSYDSFALDITLPYGLYDISSITTLGGGDLTPVYTPF